MDAWLIDPDEGGRRFFFPKIMEPESLIKCIFDSLLGDSPDGVLALESCDSIIFNSQYPVGADLRICPTKLPVSKNKIKIGNFIIKRPAILIGLTLITSEEIRILCKKYE